MSFHPSVVYPTVTIAREHGNENTAKGLLEIEGPGSDFIAEGGGIGIRHIPQRNTQAVGHFMGKRVEVGQLTEIAIGV